MSTKLTVKAYHPPTAAPLAEAALKETSILTLAGFDTECRSFYNVAVEPGPLLDALASIPIESILHLLPDDVKPELLAWLCEHVRSTVAYGTGETDDDAEAALRTHHCVVTIED